MASPHWRSSRWFIIATTWLGLCIEAFQFSFIIPILPYMIESRLALSPAVTQRVTTELLTSYGVVSMLASPIISHFADKTSARKVPLLFALGGFAAGTVMMAIARTSKFSNRIGMADEAEWELGLGRTIQSIAGAGSWILAFASLGDACGPQHTGKVLGMAMSFVTAGVTLGHTLSGVALQLTGYWATWSIPLALLTVDIVARFLVVDKGETREGFDKQDEEGLLDLKNPESTTDEKTEHAFYSVVLTDVRILVSLASTFTYSSMICSFDTTLPLELRSLFCWGSLMVGMVFLPLQVPGIFLCPLVGWLRDRIGIRLPTILGWTSIAVLLAFLGTDLPRFRVVDEQWMFVGAIVGIGLLIPLIRDVGMYQTTSMLSSLFSELTLQSS